MTKRPTTECKGIDIGAGAKPTTGLNEYKAVSIPVDKKDKQERHRRLSYEETKTLEIEQFRQLSPEAQEAAFQEELETLPDEVLPSEVLELKLISYVLDCYREGGVPDGWLDVSYLETATTRRRLEREAETAAAERAGENREPTPVLHSKGLSTLLARQHEDLRKERESVDQFREENRDKIAESRHADRSIVELASMLDQLGEATRQTLDFVSNSPAECGGILANEYIPRLVAFAFASGRACEKVATAPLRKTQDARRRGGKASNTKSRNPKKYERVKSAIGDYVTNADFLDPQCAPLRGPITFEVT